MSEANNNLTPTTTIDHDVEAAVKHGDRLVRLGQAGMIAAVAVITFFAYHFARTPISSTTAEWGQFGDYVGGLLNPAFSFLALLALLATFRLQVRELSISARELKNSSDALQQQNETLKRQAFEATFFQLLQLLNSIADSLQVRPEIKGRTSFAYLAKQLEEKTLTSLLSLDDGFLMQQEFLKATRQRSAFCKLSEGTFARWLPVLGHYYRTLEHILQFIDQTATTPSHPLYADLVGAQLSEAEARMLFYYCLTEACPPSLKQLVEKYGLLKAAARGLVPSEALYRLVSANAFGGAYPAGWVELGSER